MIKRIKYIIIISARKLYLSQMMISALKMKGKLMNLLCVSLLIFIMIKEKTFMICWERRKKIKKKINRKVIIIMKLKK